MAGLAASTAVMFHIRGLGDYPPCPGVASAPSGLPVVGCLPGRFTEPVHQQRRENPDRENSREYQEHVREQVRVAAYWTMDGSYPSLSLAYAVASDVTAAR